MPSAAFVQWTTLMLVAMPAAAKATATGTPKAIHRTNKPNSTNPDIINRALF